jgi:ribosomal protein S18 acetylase RimI-like enzyme
MQVLSPVMLKLKMAGLADAKAIALLAEHIWRIHYPSIIGSEQVEYMLSTMHNPAQVAEQMEKGISFAYILNGEEVIGYIATSFPADGELFIHKFYIDPLLQGKGIGKKVFEEILDLNPQEKTIRLTVNRMNYKSINFYYKLGFVIEEVKDFDIGGGYFMNDFIMKYSRQ